MIPVFSSSSHAPDPYTMTKDYVMLTRNPYFFYNARTQVPTGLTAGKKTVVIITQGDSLAGASENSAYTVTNTGLIQDFSIENGGMYNAQTPALGAVSNLDFANSGFWGHRLADLIVNNGKADRVILVNNGVGNTDTSDWVSVFNWKYNVTYRRLVNTGLINADRIYFLMSIGGKDQLELIPEATVLSNLLAMHNLVREAGFTTTPFYQAMSSWSGGGTGGAYGLAVRSAITTAIATSPNVFTGADTDTIGVTKRYDGNHFNAAGSTLAANLWYDQIAGTL